MKSILKSKSTKIVITLLLCIFILFFLSTIAYSAFSSTMNITGIAHSRVEADVRITDFSIHESTNATSLYEEFSKDTISSSASFNANGYIVYKVEVTNYGNCDIGIYSITGLPETLSYELIDYTIKDKLCDENNKCNNLAVKEFYIKFSSSSNIEENINLKFQFEKFHNITYIDFEGTYPNSIINNDSIQIDLSYDSVELLVVDSEESVNYIYENNILSLSNVTCDVIIRKIENTKYEFQYTSSAETLTIPIDGTYKIELWGAGGSGGGATYGGYVSGNISLKANTNLYVYVGESGKSTRETRSGFNGGGAADISGHTEGIRYSGGGATDIRLVSGTWNNFDSLKSRIMVAGGSGSTSQTIGGVAGGLSGYGDKSSYSGGGGTQISGGSGKYSSQFGSTSKSGSFGAGGAGANYASGGGSGYYGGGGGVRDTTDGGGGGGSSFISGHNGCNAISESSTKSAIVHTYQSNHYSGHSFFNTQMIDGAGYSWTTEKGSYTGMPTYDGTSTMTGNSGDGYAKITLIDVRLTYAIKYIGIVGDYPTQISGGNDLNIDFEENAPKYIEVTMNGVRITDYSYNEGVLYIKNITGDVVVRATKYEYEYIGNYQTFNAPYTGIYKIELWGAGGSGGGATYGGYVAGNIMLEENTNLYVYVGERGKDTNETRSGFNGGGAADISGHTEGIRYSGGGATDIRITSGTWNNATSLKSRIMVAGGSGSTSETIGAVAGGLSGYGDKSSYSGSGGTQINGGSGKYSSLYSSTSKSGSFGAGRAGANYASGGGSGYYGGGGGVRDTTDGSGGGGSSFISGHNGCVAISSSTSLTPRNDSSGTKCTTGTTDITCSYHYSGYKFTDTIMIDGLGYSWTTSKGTEVVGMPTYDGTSTMTGNTGNGYAKITLLKLT